MKHVLLVGAGKMAIEYYKVLTALAIPVTVVGNSVEGVSNFKNSTGASAIFGGIRKYLMDFSESFTHVINCVSVDKLFETTELLVRSTQVPILVEKPGFCCESELTHIRELNEKYHPQVCIGYNRRFYKSVEQTIKLCDEDGGILSMEFNFTEWGHLVNVLEIPRIIKENWFYANSTHVIDLAFFLAGKPEKMHSISSAGTSWHPAGSRFVGSGITKMGVLFSYHSNWDSAGRWGISLYTKDRKIILSPLEKINIQERGRTDLYEFELEQSTEDKYKTGLYKQVNAFLNNDYGYLVGYSELLENFCIYRHILHGSSGKVVEAHFEHTQTRC